MDAAGRQPKKHPSTRGSLLARLRKGKDAEAWRQFAELYTPVVYRYCRRRGLQDADSRDVTQKVLARVYGGIGGFTYDRERARFRQWLGAISIREIIRHQQRQRRPGQGAGGGQGDSVAEHLSAAVDPQWLEEFDGHVLEVALAQVRPGFDDATWKAFDLTWIGNVKPQDAAAQIGKSAAWVYKARFRVLKRLREEVEFLTEDAAVLHRPM